MTPFERFDSASGRPHSADRAGSRGRSSRIASFWFLSNGRRCCRQDTAFPGMMLSARSARARGPRLPGAACPGTLAMTACSRSCSSRRQPGRSADARRDGRGTRIVIVCRHGLAGMARARAVDPARRSGDLSRGARPAHALVREGARGLCRSLRALADRPDPGLHPGSRLSRRRGDRAARHPGRAEADPGRGHGRQPRGRGSRRRAAGEPRSRGRDRPHLGGRDRTDRMDDLALLSRLELQAAALSAWRARTRAARRSCPALRSQGVS